MTDILAEEKAYLRANLEALSQRYPGKYLLIKNNEVYGGYETFEQGVDVGVDLFGSGPFLVRSVLHPDDLEAPSIPALAIGVPFVARP